MTNSSRQIIENLQGKILISTAKIQISPFKDSLVLICEHSEQGSMGIIINKNSDLSQNELISQVNSDTTVSRFNNMVLEGGPLKKDQGFVLHTPTAQRWKNSKFIDNNLVLTTSKDIVEAISTGEYTGDFLIALGYCSWDSAQLENEIKRNDWLLAPNVPLAILCPDNESKRKAVLKNIGIEDISALSPNMGNA